MNVRRILHTALLTVFTATISCVEPYDLPYSDREVNLLVIDGFLDSGSKTATVKLSHAVPLHASSTHNPVRYATVIVEREDGTTFSLKETSEGTYTVASDEIQTGQKYRLSVEAGSRQYISDDVVLKASPVLDDVTWGVDSQGVTIYVDSHDVAGSTRYYLWNFTETWEYNSAKYSLVRFDKDIGALIPRSLSEIVYVCYKSATSTRVLISNTTTNTLDVVNDFPLAFIPAGHEKISRLYSIEVEQRAIDQQAYTYWLNLQKTTENLGGLFDPLPSEVTGNVRNARDASETVLGYFSGGEIQRKRIYINYLDLPPNITARPKCDEWKIANWEIPRYRGFDMYPVEVIRDSTVFSAGPCVDCRLRGGVLEPPPFWPER